MGEYRVMHLSDAYEIQEKIGGLWQVIGEFDDIESAKKMVRDLRENA